jgi:hypothetical protein
MGTMPISPIGFQYLFSQPGIFLVMRGVGSIVIFWIIGLQGLQVRLWVDKDETASLASYNFKPARNSKYPVPSLKKKVMLMRPTYFTGNRFHCLSDLLS